MTPWRRGRRRAHAGAGVLCVDVLPAPRIVPDRTVEFGARALDAVRAEQAARRERLAAAGIPAPALEPVAVQRHLLALVRPARRGGAPVTPGGAGSVPEVNPASPGCSGSRWTSLALISMERARSCLPLSRAWPCSSPVGFSQLLVAGRPGGWPVVALVALTAGCAYAPGSVLVGVLGLFATAIQLGQGALDARAVATALALYLTWLVCALAAAVPAAGRVEVAVRSPALRRAIAVAVLTVLVAVAAAGARAGGVRAGSSAAARRPRPAGRGRRRGGRAWGRRSGRGSYRVLHSASASKSKHYGVCGEHPRTGSATSARTCGSSVKRSLSSFASSRPSPA